MNSFINKIIFNQLNLDSASLTMQGSITHRLDHPGEYYGQIRKNNAITGHFKIIVNEKYPDRQVNMDLKALENQQGNFESRPAGNCFTLSPKGFCVLHVSGGAGGYSVTIFQSGENPTEKAFNSRDLLDGDIFTASIIRPGIYQATNTNNKTSAEIVVPYPKRADKKLVLKPVTVECRAECLYPEKAESKAGNVLIFKIKTPSRIKIDLKQSIDGPDRYDGPDDVPRSIERKVLAVINSYDKPEFLVEHFAFEKGKGGDMFLAKRIIEIKKKMGRFGNLSQIFNLNDSNPEEFTDMVNSLKTAYDKMTGRRKK